MLLEVKCIGCTQPPPPFLIVHTSGWPRVNSARLTPGSNAALLISHSVSPPRAPLRWSVNVRVGRVFSLRVSITGSGRRDVGMWLLSTGRSSPSMTTFTIGTQKPGSKSGFGTGAGRRMPFSSCVSSTRCACGR
jgi:hypothetical protein